MIAFFDTNIHISLLTAAISFDHIVQQTGSFAIRLAPIVASERLGGVSSQPRSVVERLVKQLVSLEPPSWAAMLA